MRAVANPVRYRGRTPEAQRRINADRMYAWRRTKPENAARYDPQEYLRHRERIVTSQRKHRLRKAYGLTHEDYVAMFEAQGGVCAICHGVNPKGERLCIDHDHRTGENRQLLCRKCNMGIGLFNDDPEMVLAAGRYLQAHQKKKAEAA